MVALTCLLLGFGAFSYVRGSTWEAEIEAANARAAHFQLAYRETADAWEERARQALEDDELRERLREHNEALERDLDRRNARLLSLQHTVSQLHARLDSSRTTAVQDGTRVRVDVDESVTLMGGGHVSVLGTLDIETEPDPPEVASALDVDAAFPLTVVYSRNEDGEIIVNAYTGDPRLTLSRVDVTRLAEQPASGLDLGGLTDQIVGVSPWVNRLLGLGVCLAVK